MKTRIYCFNDTFSVLPESFLGRELPKFGQVYHISYQIVDNGQLYVELEEIPSLLFKMEEHFILLHEPVQA